MRTLYEFKPTGISSFHRIKVKTERNWWQQLLFWWSRDIDIPLYNYEIEMHTTESDAQAADIVLMTEEDIHFYIKMSHKRSMSPTFIQMKTIAPTPKWIIFSDFKKSNYVIIGRSYREGY